MKNIYLFGILSLWMVLFITCKDKNSPINIDEKYIESAEVISPQAEKTVVDNFAHTITIDFAKGTDGSKTAIKLNLSSGVTLVEPLDLTSSYDLTKEASVKVKKDVSIVTFRIKVNYLSVPFNPSSKGWEKKTDIGTLPDYISVYKYTNKVNNKPVQAYIAVSNMNNLTAKFSVLGEKKGVKTPKQFYDANSQPKIVMNAGYFWDATSLGLIVRGNNTIVQAQPMAWRNYNGVSTVYYPTQGVFGMNTDNTFSAHWAYDSKGVLYTYPSPSPNKAGDKPQNIPSETFPSGAKPWSPKEAVGAGPILIKDGKYQNLWEPEMFDASSGIGPTINNPRSAIGYTPSGFLVFFACEGRNKTPDTPGLTLQEVAYLLLDLGCTEAINLDGGGSSCLLINGTETIKPSDNSQRAITSVVVLY